ncbi:hypothetical protein DFJ74DRAFT_742091, partial [Hyaloraphidium curvatum]
AAPRHRVPAAAAAPRARGRGAAEPAGGRLRARQRRGRMLRVLRRRGPPTREGAARRGRRPCGARAGAARAMGGGPAARVAAGVVPGRRPARQALPAVRPAPVRRRPAAAAAAALAALCGPRPAGRVARPRRGEDAPAAPEARELRRRAPRDHLGQGRLRAGDGDGVLDAPGGGRGGRRGRGGRGAPRGDAARRGGFLAGRSGSELADGPAPFPSSTPRVADGGAAAPHHRGPIDTGAQRTFPPPERTEAHPTGALAGADGRSEADCRCSDEGGTRSVGAANADGARSPPPSANS